MRRLLAAFILPAAVVASLVVLATPASAQGGPLPCVPTSNGNGAIGCTAHMTTTIVMDPTAMTCPNGTVIPGGHFVANVSGVYHITIMGDQAWDTGTLQGGFTLTQSTNNVNYTGHIETWFGDSINVNNFLFHATFNIAAHGADGSNLAFHMVIQFVTNGTGQIVVNSSRLVCS